VQPEATRGGGLIGKPQALGCFNQAGLRTALAPFMREPKKLEGLFSNARRNGLYLCKTQQRWDLKKVVFWLLKNGYLKPDITERRVGDWLEHTL